MTAATLERVLFIGLGAMGAPMAARVIGSGRQVWLYDADTERALQVARECEGSGTAVLGNLEEAASLVDAVILMLPTSDVVESVLLGDGLLTKLKRSTLVVDMGSSRPDSTRHLASEAREAGQRFVDAPVSGGVPRARTGDLQVIVGGGDDDVEVACPLLGTMGSAVTHVGPVGAGHALKALNNLLNAIGLTAAAEVLAVGEQFGIDPAVIIEVINRSTGRNHATEHKFPQYVLSGRFDSGFPLALMAKDVSIATDLAQKLNLTLPLSTACLQIWQAALQQLPAGADHTEIASYVRLAAAVDPKE